MNLFWTLVLGYTLVFILDISLGIFLLLKGTKKPYVIWFAITAIFSGLYAIPYLLLMFWPEATFLARSAWIGTFIIPSYLIAVMFYTNCPFKKIRWLGIISIIPGFLFFIIAISTDLLIKKVISWYPEREWIYGPLNPITRVYFLICLFYACCLLIKNYKSASPFQKQKIKYFLFGMLIYSIGGIVFIGIQPFYSIKRLDDMPCFFSIIWIICTAYAIFRYKLLDIEFVLSRTITSLFVVILLFLFHIIYVGLIKDFIGYPFANFTSLTLILVLFIGTPLRDSTKRLFDNIFLGDRYIYQDTLRNSIKMLNNYLELEGLLRYIIDTIKSTIGPKRAALLLPDENGYYRVRVGYGLEEDIRDRPIKNGLVDWLNTKKKIFIKEEWQEKLPDWQFSQLYQLLYGFGAEACVPLLHKGDLKGIITLDHKSNGHMYTAQDMDILDALGTQAAVAIENARLYYEASIDGLTRLYHHRAFEIKLKEILEYSKKTATPFGLLMIDIDHFKELNDRYGHQCGDSVLLYIVENIRSSISQEDIAARYGGEEFAVILTGSQEDKNSQEARNNAATSAESLRKKIESGSFLYQGYNLKITISIGVTVFNGTDLTVTPERIIKTADNALYNAKQEGRNRTCFLEV